MGVFKDLLEKNEKDKLEAIVAPFASPNTETIGIDQLVPLQTKVFKNYDGDKLERLVQSIREHGVLNPILIRPLPDERYEILSGNNRVHAARLAGLKEVPARCLNDVSDDEANLIALETNFCQRSMDDIPYSERAGAIFTWYEIQKRQGLRTDLINDIVKAEKDQDFGQNGTSVPLGQKLENARSAASENFNLGSTNVYRYIRIHKLVDELKALLDAERIPFQAAVNLSFLNELQQQLVYQVLSENEQLPIFISHSENLKLLAKSGKLNNPEDVLSILKGEKKAKESAHIMPKITLKPEMLSKYFDLEKGEKEITEEVKKAIILREVTIPKILAEHGVTDTPEEFTEKAVKFYLQNSKNKEGKNE